MGKEKLFFKMWLDLGIANREEWQFFKQRRTFHFTQKEDKRLYHAMMQNGYNRSQCEGRTNSQDAGDKLSKNLPQGFYTFNQKSIEITGPAMSARIYTVKSQNKLKAILVHRQQYPLSIVHCRF